LPVHNPRDAQPHAGKTAAGSPAPVNRQFTYYYDFSIVDFPQSVVIPGKYRGYMDCALYILSS